MTSTIQQLNPSKVFYFFAEICKIPRPSKKEERIAQYLINFAKERSLFYAVDKVGNVLIRKMATKGFEQKSSVVLQSHIDMVCEKNSDYEHDFETDPILPYIDGDWIKAKGTTLGADDGIGIATQLAILDSMNIEHGPIECLFTVDEETGLTGAFNLEPGFLNSKILLNLDSEDEGQIYIGCAGGIDTVAHLNYSTLPINPDTTSLKIIVGGLKGGHSGDDINKGLGSSVKILSRILWVAMNQFTIQLVDIDAGNLRNAIAREGWAIVAVNNDQVATFSYLIDKMFTEIKNELKITDSDVFITIEKAVSSSVAIKDDDAFKLVNALSACPHGVIAMSYEIDNFVETSTNLASVKKKDYYFEITTSQRSSVESAKKNIASMVEATFLLAGATVHHSDGYPGWSPNAESPILKLADSIYKELFGIDPLVLAIHAGLECGLIGEKYPEMDMISFGPTMKGAHSPDERLSISSVLKFWDFTLEILRRIP
ncbi:MAG: aminoacyl-histidine dipeptidase [Bacteroidetes bacterium]|nr:aminoacyl-histidine dipeptidase [Bacteroidota bacterium]